jgi:hypothetical protein
VELNDDLVAVRTLSSTCMLLPRPLMRLRVLLRRLMAQQPGMLVLPTLVMVRPKAQSPDRMLTSIFCLLDLQLLCRCTHDIGPS